MPYGLELVFAQVDADGAWSGGYLHPSGCGAFETPQQVLDYSERWTDLGHAGRLPWEKQGPVDVVGVIFD